MRCEVEHVEGDLYRCKRCKRLCRAPSADVKMQCGNPGPKADRRKLSDKEATELFGENDPSLLGNKVAELFKAIGIPPCGGCNQRREWMNRAHAWARELYGS